MRLSHRSVVAVWAILDLAGLYVVLLSRGCTICPASDEFYCHALTRLNERTDWAVIGAYRVEP